MDRQRSEPKLEDFLKQGMSLAEALDAWNKAMAIHYARPIPPGASKFH